MDPQPDLPEQGALAQVIKQTKKKKRRHKLKLSAKQKLIEKLDKASVSLLKNDEQTNILLKTIASWLERKELSVHKMLYQLCLKISEQDLLNELNDDNDDDEDDEEEGKAKEEKTPEKLEILPPINDDDLNFEELMKTATKYVDSTENINEIDETPVLNIDYKVSYEDFKMVVTDLDIPCNAVGLHTICKLLDPNDTSELDYRIFTPATLLSHLRHKHIDCIRFIVGTERPTKSARLDFKKEIAKNFASQYPLYLKFDIKFAVFAADKDYRGHVKNEIIYSHMKVYSLKEMIRQRFDIATNVFYLFKETATDKQYLDDKKTLEDYGYIGENDYNKVLNDSKKNTLFYDYEVGKPDPIVHCDYYFIKE